MTISENCPLLVLNGYEPKTTFWQDFSIAEAFGVKAIRETYVTAFEQRHDNYIYLTELVLVLNLKIWEHYRHNDEYGRLYDELWRMADDFAVTYLKGDEATYFFETNPSSQRSM